jgi:hypothetical protein
MKPDWKKIIVFVIMVIILSQIKINFACPDCPTYQGFPFPIYTSGGLMPPLGVERTYNLDYIPLFLDLITWYLLSCIMVWIYDKFRKKK